MGVMEFDLDMEIRPVKSLEAECGIDALIMSDLKTVYVDQDQYMDGRYDNRLRFSLAHELGHKVLHADYYAALGISKVEDVFSFHKQLSDEDYRWMEWHASEFAGRLLVPPNELIKATQELLDKHSVSIKSAELSVSDTLDIISPSISPVFGVSDGVIQRRLKNKEVVDQLTFGG
jgi:Zn-dependent peptidase ImmA (M78 family)